jgi:hypothetical protein
MSIEEARKRLAVAEAKKRLCITVLEGGDRWQATPRTRREVYREYLQTCAEIGRLSEIILRPVNDRINFPLVTIHDLPK